MTRAVLSESDLPPPRARGDASGDAAAYGGEFVMSDDEFRRITAKVFDLAGIVLKDHKRQMVYTRLSRRLRATGLTAFDAYMDLLERPEGAADAALPVLRERLAEALRAGGPKLLHMTEAGAEIAYEHDCGCWLRRRGRLCPFYRGIVRLGVVERDIEVSFRVRAWRGTDWIVYSMAFAVVPAVLAGEPVAGIGGALVVLMLIALACLLIFERFRKWLKAEATAALRIAAPANEGDVPPQER